MPYRVTVTISRSVPSCMLRDRDASSAQRAAHGNAISRSFVSDASGSGIATGFVVSMSTVQLSVSEL